MRRRSFGSRGRREGIGKRLDISYGAWRAFRIFVIYESIQSSAGPGAGFFSVSVDIGGDCLYLIVVPVERTIQVRI